MIERCKKMPIIDVSLLRRRMVFKKAFEECNGVLCAYKHGDAKQGVPLSTSVSRNIMQAVAMVPFFRPKKYVLSQSDVARFEWFAEMAVKLVRDVESGCSLAHYRFLNPLIRHLLNGKILQYKMVQGSRTRHLTILTDRLEEHGVVAKIRFVYEDSKEPMKSFRLLLTLRLSESTDIFGIAVRCLQSVTPELISLAELATGELTQISTRVHILHPRPVHRDHEWRKLIGTNLYLPDPLCCTTNGLNPFSNNSDPLSEFIGRFPEEVCLVVFSGNISTSECNFSMDIKKGASPSLLLTVFFLPHSSWELEGQGLYLPTSSRGSLGRLSDCDLESAQMAALEFAICHFHCEPEETEFQMHWCSAHGSAHFYVRQPIVGMKTIGEGSQCCVGSKRKRHDQ
jgi:hypothetical protein